MTAKHDTMKAEIRKRILNLPGNLHMKRFIKEKKIVKTSTLCTKLNACIAKWQPKRTLCALFFFFANNKRKILFYIFMNYYAWFFSRACFVHFIFQTKNWLNDYIKLFQSIWWYFFCINLVFVCSFSYLHSLEIQCNRMCKMHTFIILFFFVQIDRKRKKNQWVHIAIQINCPISICWKCKFCIIFSNYIYLSKINFDFF